MRVVLFVNGWVGWKVTEYLGKRKDVDIVGLVMHPKARRMYGREILQSAGLPQSCVFDGSALDQPGVPARLVALKPDMGVSAYFGYILGKNILHLFPRGVVNVHPGYLPWNRGAATNVWSIVDRTPAGVTLHEIDAGVDTGAILAQERIAVEPVDTGKTLHRRLEHAAFRLFKKSWHPFATGRLKAKKQPAKAKTEHRIRDVDAIDRIDLDRRYTARELIDIVRARTFPPYTGAYFMHNGRKVHMHISLAYGK